MHHITYFERQVIESGLRVKKSVRAIAWSLRRDHRVIQKEVNRNRLKLGPYTAALAQALVEKRAKERHQPKLSRAKHQPLRAYITEQLRGDWSPEQIAGVLVSQPPAELQGARVCQETIYQYIYGQEGKALRLYQHLRRARPKRQTRWARKSHTSPIPERVSIHWRPAAINDRSEAGHWESDTLEGKRTAKPAVSVQYERKLQLARLHRFNDKSAPETEQALRDSIRSVPEPLFCSVTFDNGREGTTHGNLRRDFGIATYFCDPYASWQKGGVENLNGLLRQYLPKGSDFSRLTDEYLHAIQEKLNNRPRKKLNYLTPNQALALQVGH